MAALSSWTGTATCPCRYLSPSFSGRWKWIQVHTSRGFHDEIDDRPDVGIIYIPQSE
jgi:hypothetical protein